MRRLPRPRKPRQARLTIEQLESRCMLASAVLEQLTGSNFSRIEPGVSINNVGEVGFVGETAAGEAVYLVQKPNDEKLVSFPPGPDRNYGSSVSINNRQRSNEETRVVAMELINGSFLLRRWDGRGNGNGQLLATSYLVGPLGDPDGFDGIQPVADINDLNRVVLVGMETGVVSLQKLGVREGLEHSVNIGSFPFTFGQQGDVLPAVALRPQMSNTSEVVFQSASGKSILKTEACGEEGDCSFGSIASPASGYSATGRAPGITSDGSAVAFYGRDKDGPGIFLSVLQPGADRDSKKSGTSQFARRSVFRIAGLPDELGAGMQLEDFEVDSRIGVGGGGDLRGSPTAAVTYYVTYKAINPASGRMALYWQDIQIRLIVPERQEVAGRVELIGQSIPIVIAELGKLHSLGTANPPTQQVRLQEIELHDPISDSGQVAFWGLTTSGEQAVFRANPAAGKVLTVLTHGFGRDLSDPIGPFKGIFGDEFIDVFHDLADTFEKLPAPGSHLENQVQTYVASWDSSDGWFQAWFTWGTSVIADLISNKVEGTGINGIELTAVLKLSFEALANYLKEVGDLYLENAGRNAEAAAVQIVDDLLESGKLGTPQQTRSLEQIVHLVGHSRGAAVNARVAQSLTRLGYYVHQFTALDGYSTDWPDGSDFLADIDIAGTIRMIDTDPAGGGLGRRDNYRVAEPLHKLVWDWVLPMAQWAAQRYLGVSPSGYSQPLLDLLVRESHDWRAPERRLFPDETEIPQGTESEKTVNTVINIIELFDNGAFVPKLTDHTTISRAYLQSVEKNAPSHQFALKNYLGEHRCDGAPNCPSPRAEGEPSMGSVIQAILDGNFEKVGSLSRKARQLSVPSFNDPLFDGIVKLASDPSFLLSAAWQQSGAVALDTSTDDSFVIMSQHTNGSSLGQMVFIGEAASSLRFDLQTRASAADAELQILFGGDLIQSIDLVNSPRGLQTIDFSKLAGRSGQLWFRLVGGGGQPVQITLDDIALSEGDTSPLVLNDQLRIDEGRSATFTVLHNDLARGPNIQPASLRIERAPAFGTATVDNQGVIRYVPNPAFRGMDLLEYSVANSTGQRSTFAQVQIEVRTDLPPIAVADYVQLTKGKQATFQPAENDFDPEQQLVLSTIQIASPPSHGSVSVFESGAVRYVPHSDFVGTDSFSYRLADAAGNLSSAAMVQLEVANAFPQLHITLDDQPWLVGQALNFGQTTTMSTNVRRQVQVRNLGLAPLRIDNASIVGSGFRLLPFDRLPLGQGGELTIIVEMLDQPGGTLQSAQLRLNSNDPLQPLITIPLLGELAPLPMNAVAGSGRFTSEKTFAESEILIPAGTDFRSMAVMVDLPWESDNQANITLYAPDGTSLALGTVSNPKELFSGPMRILFSDAATKSLGQYERNLGRYRPNYAFTDLGSSATEGVWRLTIDRWGGSAETFQWWLIPDLQPTDITLADLPARSARVGEKISFDIQAGSADQQPLFFEMISDDERGAHLDPIHGRFEWLVPENAGPEHEFVVIVRKAEEQWANAVINVSSGQDKASYLLGSPDGWSWNASDIDKGLETIEVSFERPTRSYGARIREYAANGFVRKIEARDTDGAYHVVWSDWDPTPSNDYRYMFATWPLTEYTVVSLRISIDTMHVINGQESIDGVALLGLPAQPISKIQEFVLPVTGRPRMIEMTPSQGASLNMLQEVELRFSEAMDRASVEEVRNYVLTDSQGFALRIASASYSENHGFSVSLRIDSRSGLRTGQYSLSVMGTALKSAQGISMSKAGTQLMAVVGMDQQAVALEMLSKELRASRIGGFEFGIESSGRFEVADLDNDGVLDMVAMNQRAPTLGFFKGLGSGKYANVKEIALSGMAQEVFIADWDGDGKLDLIVPTTLNQFDGSGAVGYDIFINDGRADFSHSPDSPLPFHYGSGPGLVANVLGDSRPEIIQTGYVTLSSGRIGGVLQIIGADRFLGYNIVAELQPPPGREESSPSQLFVRDFTGDGRMDVLTNNFEFGRNGFVSLYRGQSNGLASYEEVPVDVFRNATLQVDDFNNDGRLDLVALEDRFSINADIYDGNVLHFLQGQGDGTFEQMPEKMLNGRGAGLATVGDVNGDGFSDLVLNVAAYTSPNYTHLKLSDDNALWIWNGDGRGNFQATTPSPVALPDHQHIQPNIVRLAELTGDGLPEILLGSPATSQIGVLKNMGGSLLLPLREWNLRTGFTPHVADARGSTRNGEPGYVLTDLNGDQAADIIMLGSNAGGLSLEVLLADPLLGYRHSHSMALGLTVAPAWLEAGDVDSDGLIDLIIGDGNQNIVFLKGLGGSSFLQSDEPLPRIPSEVGYGVQDGQLTDVNLDGFLDLIVTVTTLWFNGTSNLGAAVYFGSGDGLFSFNRNTLVTQYQATQVLAADFNGDLFPDLISFAITPNNDVELRFFAGRGNGTFLAGKVSPLQNIYSIDYFRIGDVNRDGYLDLIGSGAAEVLLGDGQGGFQHHRTLANDLVNRWFAGITDISLSDFDGDGLLDVMIAYYPGRFGINLDTITLFRGTKGVSYLDNGTDIVVGGKPRGANRLIAVDRGGIMEVGQFELLAALPPVTLSPSVNVSPLAQQLSGTSSPGANVTVTLADRVLGVARASENGKWILNLETLLPIGVHQVTLSARDNQGRTTEIGRQEIEIRPQGLSYDWTNPRDPLDVDDDGVISPLDVLMLVNTLNRDGSRNLPILNSAPEFYYDVDSDELVSPLDVLLVINFLNRLGGDAEGESGSFSSDSVSEMLFGEDSWLWESSSLAIELSDPLRRRRR
jgi:hypothetical protein